LSSSPADPSTTATTPALRGWWILLLIAVVIWCGNLEYRKLSLSDEGRYSEIPRYMAQSGDWVTPRLNGIKYFEKPPLQYWATATAYRVFGEHNWTARIWPALTGLLGVVLMYFVGARLYGRTAGFYTAAVLASSVLYAALAHILTLDMGLAFFLTVAYAGLVLALDPRADATANRRWMHVAAAGCALAVLSKGLIGIVLPGAVVTLYLLLKRDFGLLRRLHLVSCAALFLAITAPWFIAVSLANPEFAWFFFVHEHLQRYTSTIHQRYQPWYFFIPILAAGMLPWLVTLIDAIGHAYKGRAKDARFDPLYFSLLWAGFIFAFFSASGSKLPSYILPIFPALALLIGVRLTTISGRVLAWQLAPVAMLAIAGLIAVPYTVRLATDNIPAELYRAQMPWLYAAGLTLLAGTLAAIYFGRTNRVRQAVLACALTGLATTQLLVTSEDALSPAHSTYHAAQKLKPYLKPGMPFYSVRTYEQTLPFYIDRTVTLVEYQDEMAYGLQQEPQLWVPTLAEFKTRWGAEQYALAVMSLEVFAELEQARLPMQVIVHDTERIFVRTPPR